MHYVTRVTQPTLMLNGELDFFFPAETSQLPMFELLGTPPEHKRRITYPRGHTVSKVELTKETLSHGSNATWGRLSSGGREAGDAAKHAPEQQRDETALDLRPMIRKGFHEASSVQPHRVERQRSRLRNVGHGRVDRLE